MKQIFAPAFAALCALGVVAAPVAAHAKAFTEIKFGVDATYPPFESLSPSGDFQGFDIDLGKAICAQLKVKCVFVSQGFDGIIPALQARKFDAILSSMTVTPERAKQINFSSEMYNEPTSLIEKKGAGLQPTAESLKGKTVGVEAGTIQETYAKTYWQPQGVNVVSYPGQDQVYADLLSGRLDASLQDSVEASYGFLKTPKGADYAFGGNVTYDPKDVLGSYIAIGVRKDEPELLKKIDEAIAAIHANGTYKKIEAQYFNFDVYGATPAAQ
ncbi:ABC transporter substrate-binding protein [Acidocella aromatica]|uniref:Lysine/arginine/ornithine transport system substrate-binding protein n=1 Tax=Acidocella aromatica TaxID=1303579 RepID=A0A840VGV7_9PROT|nr:ABC transporter substrate-binding protein [Acidocella aromatica]MBB5374137.1 lysine/arginine/ornithine transport system substrate-binding protein [Acidocella aromatica]